MKDCLVPVGIYQLVKLLHLTWLASVAKAQTADQALLPRNVSIFWKDFFNINLSWILPENGKQCINTLILDGNKLEILDQSFSTLQQLNKGFLEISLKSICDNNMSDPVELNITYPVFIRDFQCFLVSSNLTDCSWNTALNVTDFKVFIWSQNEDGTANKNEPVDLKECSEYQYIESTKSGCHLQGNFQSYVLHFLFNGTLDNKLVNNTFEIRPRKYVRFSPLNWTVTEIGDQLEIKWIPPDILDWTYTINYTKCEESQSISVPRGTSTNITVDPYCQYRISIQGKTKSSSGTGETLWSKEILYGGNKNPDAVMHTVFIAITVIVIVAALTIVCLRKHKEKILPKVPEPPLLLKEMLNKPMDIVGELYTPVQEEQNNKITLVVDQ